MIVATVALMKEKPGAGEEEILRWMNGNLCRCCNYANILNAVKRAVETGGAGAGRQAP